jgi:hypothetical protein
MIGYAPVLGPVRLVGLGQAADEEVRRQKALERISTIQLKIETVEMRPDVRKAFSDKFATCVAQFQPAKTVAQFDALNKCFDEVEEALRSPLLPMLSTREEVERREAAAAPGTIPPWAWIVGGLAAAGLAGWLIYKKS